MTRAGLIAVIIILAGSGGVIAGDSTRLAGDLEATKRPDPSIVGTVRDGMTCKYLNTDRKIHCTFSDSPRQEYLVEKTIQPAYSRFQPNKPGKITITNGARYAFVNPVSETRSGTTTRMCKLALQFITGKNEIIWIWHDEFRYGTGGTHAALDTNGDGLADLAVKGAWNGRLHGVARWQPNGASGTLSQADSEYPARPDITAVSNAMGQRGCKPALARVAVMKPLTEMDAVGTKVPVWTTTNAP